MNVSIQDKSDRVLVVAVLFKNKGAIGGMAQRFAMLSNHMINSRLPIELLTSQSLLSHLGIKNSKEFIILDDKSGISLLSYFRLLRLFFSILLGRYRRVHFAGGGKIASIVNSISKVRGLELSCTFASRTLEMASYGRQEDLKAWQTLLDNVNAIDVLNPSHNLDKWRSKISVSPCSFPSRNNGINPNLSNKKKSICVFSGALEATKNPKLALDIFTICAERTAVNIEMVLFGKGTMSKSLEGIISDINQRLGRRAVRIGTQEEYLITLSSAAVFFSLQEHDNYPSQSLMEAMLSGCRCIVTDEGDSRLMFPANESNAIVNSRNPNDFIADFDRLIFCTNPSIANREHILRYHNIGRFSEYFEEFLWPRLADN